MTANKHLRCSGLVCSGHFSKVCSLPYAQLMLAFLKQLDKCLGQEEHRYQHGQDNRHVYELKVGRFRQTGHDRRQYNHFACAL